MKHYTRTLTLFLTTSVLIGQPTFTESAISTSADGANSVYAYDLDGDGDMDVLSASLSDNKVAWYETTWYWYENNGCTADDGTEGVELWGECYNIETTTELDLEENQLTGEIPSEIGNLINLEHLNFFLANVKRI